MSKENNQEFWSESLEGLENNPVFAMSLGSKELFHSNFLAWLLTDETLKDKTKGLRHLLIGSSEQKIFHVDREKYNFDLLITNGEEVEDESENSKRCYTVIENKFKSMPRIDQLREYSQKIWSKKALKGKTECVLLAPKISITKFKEKYKETKESICINFNSPDSGESRANEMPIIWKFCTYEDVIKCLNEFNIPEVKTGTEFIVSKYCEFVNILLIELKNLTDKNFFPCKDDDKVFSLPNKQEPINTYTELRIDDLIKKMWAEHLGLALKNWDFKSGEYSNGTAILTIKAPGTEKSEDFFAVQIQDGRLKVCFELRKDNDFVIKLQRKEGNQKEDNAIYEFLQGCLKAIKDVNVKFSKDILIFEDFVPNSRSSYLLRSYNSGKERVFLYEQIDLSQSQITIKDLRCIIYKIFEYVANNKKTVGQFMKTENS